MSAFFGLKKKDRDKLEKEKKSFETSLNFKDNYQKYMLLQDYSKEFVKNNEYIWFCNNSLKHNIEIIIRILQNESYIDCNKIITKKGIIAMGINECQELVFTEMIYKGLLDNLSFAEIVAVLSCFINEKDQNGEQKYISDLNVPKSVRDILNKIKNITEYFIDIEEQNKLYIYTDYNLYLDFIEPSYIWANKGTINDIYQNTNIYDGNFVKSIMRINNICENLMDICKNIERYDLCAKLENYNSILIRDITSINSLYVK